MSDVDLFGDPIPQPLQSAVRPRSQTEIDRMLLRGEHPATLRPTNTEHFCRGCRYLTVETAMCRFAELPTREYWPACDLFDSGVSATRSTVGSSSARSARTSRQAAGVVNAGSQKGRALAAVAAAGAHGLTAFEVASKLQMSPNQVAARLGELHKDGFLRFKALDGVLFERVTTPGCSGRVHFVTAAGAIEADRYRQT